MAEARVEPREINLRQLFPWTELFRGFQVAMDPKKLVLAAAGILVMSAGWQLLSLVFYSSWSDPTKEIRTLDEYKKDFPSLSGDELEKEASLRRQRDLDQAKTRYDMIKATAGPGGRFSTWPWFEDRGPNPFLLVTGQAGQPEGNQSAYPWLQGRFLDWFVEKQLPVLVEPLAKFYSPVVYMLKPQAGFMNRLYFALILLWTLATWALFGGAITRMAIVQVARNEKIGVTEAVRFVIARYLSYLSAPLFPLLFVAFMVVGLVLFGVVHMIPLFGDIVWDGLLWPLVIAAGLAIAVVLVGLVGWPLMYATISAEGSDSFDAISRSYSYVYQNPWHYLWYNLVALSYGAIVVFFVGFMGSLIIYLGKWGVGQWVVESRDPGFLFVYAPTSFGWRDLLLQNCPAETVVKGTSLEADRYWKNLAWWNHAGAFMVSAWLYFFFLMIVGFGYSYFWSSSSIIYLLMRRKVDDTDIDEVYLEEDETEEPFAPAFTPPKSAAAPPTGPSVTMVESPTLRAPASSPAPSYHEHIPGAVTTSDPPPADAPAADNRKDEG